MNAARWQPFVDRYRRGEWRTPIFYDMIRTDAQRFQGLAAIVDIGCGHGFDLETRFQVELSRQCSCYIGIEPDPNAVVSSCFHEVHRCCFEDAALASGTVDIAYAVMVLEHVRDPQRFWNRLWDVLRPGGVFWGFTVDARHYYAILSSWAERLRLKDTYFRYLHSRLKREEYKHYPTSYAANSPRQISRFAASFRRKEFVSLVARGPTR